VIEALVRSEGLLVDGREVVVLFSGGRDSTCLLDLAVRLAGPVTALHVNYGLRDSADSDEAFCRDLCARIGVPLHVHRPGRPAGNVQAWARAVRYGEAARHDGLIATGHTATDQVETVLYRLVASGSTKGIKPLREDGVVRPLLDVWRDETEEYCHSHGLRFRSDSSNTDTKRGLIRKEIIPRLRALHPGAEENLRRLAAGKPSALDDLLASSAGSRRLDLGAGITAVREYGSVWLERTPVALDGEVRWGDWRIAADVPGLKVRAWRAGDRLAGRSKKIQDVFVDAKIPRSARESWPLVVRGDEVVAVPGILEAEGVRAERVAD
jgi:tRNA(Ile)-lysidine synthase